MIKGSCCCKTVQFELTELPTKVGTCHCSRCRKLGASTLLFVKAADFRITQGLDDISTLKAEPPYKYHRNFCSKCGTALGEVLSTDEAFPISAHCLDDDIELTNIFHEFVSEKPCWLKIGDDAPQFEKHPN